jgi:hypothetical protein
MSEWFKEPVLKTGVAQATVGSNPTPSANLSLQAVRSDPTVPATVPARNSELEVGDLKSRCPAVAQDPSHLGEQAVG